MTILGFLPGALFCAAGLVLLMFARHISYWKTNLWAKFYAGHAKAAKANPLSRFAGTETSIKTGAFMWRLIGVVLLLTGILRLLGARHAA